MRRDDDRAWLRERAGRGDIAVEPIAGSSQPRMTSAGDRRPCQEAKKPRINRARFPRPRASSVQGGPPKISEALVPPKPKELESA